MDEVVEEVKFVIGDTETCGLPPHHYPCELGLMQIDPVTFDVLWETVSLIDPEYPIGAKASEIHGITDDMVVDSPTLAEFVEHRLHGGITGDITMIAHNFQFDSRALTQCGKVSRTICSLFEARQSLTHLKDLQNHQLQTLAAYFGITAGKAHSALGDCDTTRQVLKKICEITGRTLEQLAQAKDRTVHTMPFGKHKGTLIVMLDKQYMVWLLALPDLEANLRKSLEKAMGLRK